MEVRVNVYINGEDGFSSYFEAEDVNEAADQVANCLNGDHNMQTTDKRGTVAIIPIITLQNAHKIEIMEVKEDDIGDIY